MKNKKMALLHSVIALLLCVSMLVGSTFAWFTDSVKTGINTIAAGVLDVELYHSNAAVQNEQVNSNTKLFMDLQGSPILWEPGVVSFENLRVANAGDLALTYQLALATDNENYIIDGNNQYGLSQILQVGIVEGGITATDRDGVVGAVTEWTTLASFLRSGSLLAAGEETWGVVVYWQPGEDDNRWNLNNGKTLNEGEALQIDLGVKLIATQEMEESDSIDKTYDENAKAEFFDGFQGGSAGAVVTADDQGITTAEVAMKGGDVSAVIPTGVQVASGVNSLALTVTKKAASEANIQLKENEEMRPLDVHIEGVAQGNTVPMRITLKQYLSTGINTGALTLYHVENGQTVAMTQVANPVNHNEFSYDPATGDVTLALASFSEVAVVADTNNPWDGKTRNYVWYDASATELTIYNADQLAGFADIVDGKAAGIAQDSFAGKTVKLANNITLSGKLFDPIGWGYEYNDWNVGDVAGKPFKGTFDGAAEYDNAGNVKRSYTIFDLHQSGWDLEDPDQDGVQDADYTYTNCGFGLFAAASGATFKNLVISGAYVRAECVEMGVLVGLSQNNCTYNNIKILDSKIANYQRPAGGLIGEVSGAGTTTITKVVIGDDVVVGSLWGDFDAPCGGVIGAYWNDAGADPQIHMTNVDVGARLDVYNDITSAYQWHAYRRAGMLIGNTDMSDPNNAHKAYAPFLHCSDVRVYYGDWVNYTYCEFSEERNSPRYPWVRTQAGENCSAFSNPRWGVPTDENDKLVTDMNHAHQDGDECNVLRQFSQLYGGGQGVYGQDEHKGVTYPANAYSITYVNDNKVLDIIYVTNNQNEVKVENDQAKKLVDEWATENMKNYSGYEFGGWMTAASVKLDKIPAKNTQNIVLYPYFTSPHTASFVDQDSNILAWCFFNEINIDNLSATFATAKDNLSNPGDDFELLYWIIRGRDEKGNLVVDEKLYENNLDWESFKGYKYDVTITPKYRYKGVDLIEVYDDLTGEIDHYQVAGYGDGKGSTIVEIPAYVNGAPITTVNKDAFGSFDDIYAVKIPATVTAINGAAFADDDKSWGVLQRETLTLYFEGTPAQWKTNMDALYKGKSRYTDRNSNVDQSATTKFASNWDENMGDGSRVFFLDENGKVVNTCYWELCKVNYGILNLSSEYIWVFHEHAYDDHGSNACEDWTSSNDKPNYVAEDRPDKGYWEGVTIN